ncbi:signal transduction histidine kinase [Clostridium acetobutylicum]|uniref:histidine kinase n=1 Tax=Clostridium acetobutylicum (strain ATCC 824 / DSM 792 / JCM 1419 / IAM 19013 / LMG 5710 / NBRC 13948 / NRRL B-527 / VKM B-1787 / 2291 / W) TaxID=272562 RepID=Q97M28_CLOAB|nr:MULTISPECIES: sensor histidine kinase [Clostridium]AAK78352.1 Sensory transduction histidine kinase (HisKA and HATPase damains) [Clostridium acetobutylicum ATCC 824]ADZ19421.1 Sensory transduction histidine kinase (HisKA and HATPase damains) [Clostridium acetobutylicum EA 2018]AEI34514.1 sensory transduction histidine kinase (HisKA and HATPase damains) [Clostridium acetobutylicum DSM 1731]AWV80076.1 sensor histidine kinase [Clostridium acetobutylicum]MBC2395898.1 HAMP domain-containing hist
MYKKIIKNFMKEKLSYSISFFLSSGIILFYFYVSKNITDVVYPIFMVVSIYIIFIVTEWFKYYRFNANLTRGIEREYYDLESVTPEQRMAQEAILKIHKNYAAKISEIDYKNSDIKYFISQWIHNMKTPVSVIDLIVQREKEKLSGDVIKNIEEENYKIKNGMDQVLNIIRLDEFSRDYEPEIVDIVELVKRTINLKKNQFIYGNAFPKVEFHVDKALVLTDKKWSTFIIDQIISNSIKYSKKEEKGYVYFNIVQSNNKTHLVIKDNGVGIPKYDLKRIFEPFFTGENGRNFENSTGIGLYICKKIADNLGHEISVESEINKGTIVKITYMAKV